MSMYRKEWSCCGDVTETDAWEPTECPFCKPEHVAAPSCPDFELLQEAAKVAGIKYELEASRPHATNGIFFGLWLSIPGEPSEYTRRYWNPLRDDGDALRLANKLCFEIRHVNGQAHAGRSDWFWCTQSWFPDGDQNAATRRAIVEAAVRFGKQQGILQSSP